jgi:uncharacterized membrane protein
MEFLSQLHPQVVHFPIAFMAIYAVLEITGILTGKEFFQKAAYLFLFLGVLSAIAAVITGNQAAEVASKWKDQGADIPTGLISEHEEYATITMWYFTGLLVLRTFLFVKKKFHGLVKYLFILLAVVGLYLIYQTGDHGGKLVYDHGVGTQLKKDEIK